MADEIIDNKDILTKDLDPKEMGVIAEGFSPDELAPDLIDVDEIETQASQQARLITERLSNFYFAEDYIKKHPYIPVKVAAEMNNIRMLLKMLAADERAQDMLIKACGLNIANSRMFSSLTTIQSTMLNIQKQLNEIVTRVETIFMNMQKESEVAFADAEKEDEGNGVRGIRGSRDFVIKCQTMAGLTNDNRRVGENTKVNKNIFRDEHGNLESVKNPPQSVDDDDENPDEITNDDVL